MGFNETLAARVRSALERRTIATVEKRMFGGLAFMVRGHMCVGLVGDDLMVRVGPERHDTALERAHARPMDFTGHAMRGFVFVAPAGCATELQLDEWVGWGLDFVATLGDKPPKPAKRRAR